MAIKLLISIVSRTYHRSETQHNSVSWSKPHLMSMMHARSDGTFGFLSQTELRFCVRSVADWVSATSINIVTVQWCLLPHGNLGMQKSSPMTYHQSRAILQDAYRPPPSNLWTRLPIQTFVLSHSEPVVLVCARIKASLSADSSCLTFHRRQTIPSLITDLFGHLDSITGFSNSLHLDQSLAALFWPHAAPSHLVPINHSAAARDFARSTCSCSRQRSRRSSGHRRNAV